MTTIFELVNNALTTLSPAVPFAMSTYLTQTGAALPDQYLVYQLISAVPEDHADNIETHRTYRVQISIMSRSGLAVLPAVDAAMVAAGFALGPWRSLPYDDEHKHFGIAKDYFYLEKVV